MDKTPRVIRGVAVQAGLYLASSQCWVLLTYDTKYPEVDALLHCTDDPSLGCTGKADVILREGVQALCEACSALPTEPDDNSTRCSVGSAIATPPGELPFSLVSHAVTPCFELADRPHGETVGALCLLRRSLSCAMELLAAAPGVRAVTCVPAQSPSSPPLASAAAKTYTLALAHGVNARVPIVVMQVPPPMRDGIEELLQELSDSSDVVPRRGHILAQYMDPERQQQLSHEVLDIRRHVTPMGPPSPANCTSNQMA